MRRVARNNPYSTTDYFTTAVTVEYLESLPREFEIPADIFLVVLGPDDMPSQPPENHVTLSVDFFQVGLCLTTSRASRVPPLGDARISTRTITIRSYMPMNVDRVEKLKERPDPKRKQVAILTRENFAHYNWFRSSSAPSAPADQKIRRRSEGRGEVPTTTTLGHLGGEPMASNDQSKKKSLTDEERAARLLEKPNGLAEGGVK
ncbi:hypothetical protein TIFTF001_033736 [Ficus carica]|uniref:Uncharacterized protein n=1 Tax=Ficus carica TaxID=3494 RepID=A0AA88DZ75_FICCA|nr:hypothetical protein TIFTF001_033736 [Ficus carica]